MKVYLWHHNGHRDLCSTNPTETAVNFKEYMHNPSIELWEFLLEKSRKIYESGGTTVYVIDL